MDLAKNLAAMLQNVLWSCGSIRISFSRRTPEKVYMPLAISFEDLIDRYALILGSVINRCPKF